MNNKSHMSFSNEVAKSQTKEQFVADHSNATEHPTMADEAGKFWDKVNAKGDEADTEKPAKPKGK